MNEEERSNLYIYTYSDLDDDFIFAETKYTLGDLHKLQQENKKLKEKLEEAEKEYDRTFCLWHNRKLIKKFDDEYDEADKKNNPERDYAYVMPDAEEVYKRYYAMKKQQKEFIKWLKQNIENEEYCYLSQNPSERCRKDVFEEVLSKHKEIVGE